MICLHMGSEILKHKTIHLPLNLRAVVLVMKREVKLDALCNENILETLLQTLKRHSRANDFLRKMFLITSF